MTATALPCADAQAPLISLADFRLLLADQHPFSLLLGIEVHHIGRGTARAVLPARDSHQRLGGIVAGPMLMGLADLAMYAAVVGATGQAHAVTASLTINFLRKSPAGAVHAEARLLKVGRLSAGEVILTGAGSDEPLAHIVSTWSVPKP
ncbi:PaaI family thioesterase [Streptomyces cavourensis]|nr:PaaI family thioesterase [Streptomyces cavourensis]